MSANKSFLPQNYENQNQNKVSNFLAPGFNQPQTVTNHMDIDPLHVQTLGPVPGDMSGMNFMGPMGGMNLPTAPYGNAMSVNTLSSLGGNLNSTVMTPANLSPVLAPPAMGNPGMVNPAIGNPGMVNPAMGNPGMQQMVGQMNQVNPMSPINKIPTGNNSINLKNLTKLPTTNVLV